MPKFIGAKNNTNTKFISYVVNPKTQDIQLFWKNDNDQILKSIKNLQIFVNSKQHKLVFAMNAGMFKPDFSAQGLFIQNNKTIQALDRKKGVGNFYLQPNGILYITSNNEAKICKTENFINNNNIKYATQSGPMLVINGKIHPLFTENSTSLYIRNGVGILPNGKLIFAMSKTPVNFYTFANYFKTAGCSNALYLDGFVSRTFLPEQNWIQTDGNFGVMIGVVK